MSGCVGRCLSGGVVSVSASASRILSLPCLCGYVRGLGERKGDFVSLCIGLQVGSDVESIHRIKI